jgi:hypothetical protein
VGNPVIENGFYAHGVHLGRACEHESERAIIVVIQHQDDRAFEVGVIEWWGGDEQPTSRRHD